MWDFTKARFIEADVMRYDTPGDWEGDTITAWKGMPFLSQRAVQLHEFNESAILRAAGITEEQIDIIDNFHVAASNFSKGLISKDELAECASLYYKIPWNLRELYDFAHDICLILERTFLEASGGNWQEHEQIIENTRGKIPIKAINI